MIPPAQREHNDLIDIVVEASKTREEIELEDGHKETTLMLNPEIVWWKTLIVNSPTFARFAFKLKEWERLARDCFDNMCFERAESIARDILQMAESYRRSADAKSSESLRDRNNTQSTLIDKINKNKVERAYTLKQDGKKSFLDGIIGKDRERDMEND